MGNPQSQIIRLIESLQDWVWEVDADAKYTYSSPQVTKLLGYAVEEVIGKTPFDFMPKDEAIRVGNIFSAIVLKQEPFDCLVNINLAKDGHSVILETSGRPFFSEEGTFLGYRGVDRDITEIKNRDHLLKTISSSFPGTLFQYTLTADDEVSIDFFIDGEIELWGHSVRNIENDPELIFEKIHPDDKEGVKDAVRQSRLKMSEISYDYRVIDKNKEMFWHRVKGIPESLFDGSTRWICIVTDITDSVLAAERRLLSLKQTIDVLLRVNSLKDLYTANHQKRVSVLAVKIAQEMGLSSKLIEGVEIAAIIHDIGKIVVPNEILTKPARLSALEYELVKLHAIAGFDLIKDVSFDWPVAQIVRQHHERIDGTGYPDGLKGEDILLEARILGVADTVESMASHRPYRPALGLDAAITEISRMSGIKYDPKVVEAVLNLMKRSELAPLLEENLAY